MFSVPFALFVSPLLMHETNQTKPNHTATGKFKEAGQHALKCYEFYCDGVWRARICFAPGDGWLAGLTNPPCTHVRGPHNIN